jgi:alpha-glucosidase
LHLANPEERGTEHIDDQYLLGPDLLVAPIFAAGATSRKLYITVGRWREWDQPARVHTGPAWITVSAPLGRLPLLVRAGAKIPMFASVPQHLKGALPKVMTKTIAA